jgi:signal transduction histidine kinase/CheY-like chemotaxis protein
MMQRWGIRNRVTLVAVLPAVVLALILTAFFTRSRIADIEDAYTERARAFARQLAASAEYPLFSGDRASLQRLAESSLIQSDILGVAVLDPEGSPLALAGSMHDASISLAIASRPVRREGQLLRLQEAVLPSRVELGGALEGPELVAQQAGPAALGYVVLDISRERLTARRNELVSISMLTLFGVLAGSLLLARKMGEGVSKPIRAIARSVEHIGQGQLSERVSVAAGGSLRRLADGINDMAARLERSHDQMQQQVQEVTAELRARKEEAELANNSKSRFLAAASHDLRQPMHALGLFISELAEQAHAPQTRRLVRQIAASAEAMEDLLDSLLDISKLDAGVLEPKLRAVSLQALFERIAREFAGAAEEHGVRLRVRPSRHWVLSDPVLLERVLNNLVSNAIRYSPRGTVLLASRRRGGGIVVEVRDDGIGIAADMQEKVFQEFVQLENAERARNKGLGLGLAIVQRLTDLLGHSLTLRSAPSRGSRFEIAIAAADSERDAAADEPERSLGDLAGRCIALVDDDPLALNSLHSLLLSWGCEVYAADSFESLVMDLATRSARPELLVSDYRLRGPRSGVDVIDEIRRRYHPDLPAILISGDTGPVALQQARERDLVLLHKPVRPAKLRALLNRKLPER